MARKPRRSVLKPPGKCIFCGRGGLTKEHIWSDWTKEHLPKLRGSHRSTLVVETAGIQGLNRVRKRQGQVDAQVRAVCRVHCNGGWMSAMEERVKPILTPLMLGGAAVLSHERQRDLAAWMAMKCMVLEFDAPETVVTPLAEREWLMHHQEAPSNWRIWIASQLGMKWRTGSLRTAHTLGGARRGETPATPDGTFAKNTQSITLGFGRLAIKAISTRVPELDLIPDGVYPRIWFQIWPVAPGFLWPAGPPISDVGFRDAALSLRRIVSAMPWRPAR